MEEAPKGCPGTNSSEAGKGDSCQGCPNQSICSSSVALPDPDIELISTRFSDVKKKILILSGKGGVGKSTLTSILARGLALSANVGVLDIDICGPSLPRIFGVEGESVHHSGSGYSPIYPEETLALMSSGFLIPLEAPVIWRGDKKTGLIKQLLRDVDWGPLDYFIVDTPPGTSDEHLSIVKYLQPDGCILISTPNEVSLSDVRKEIDFVRNPSVNVPIIGIIENMSGFSCPKCKVDSELFPKDSGGVEKLCEDLQIFHLGKIPLSPLIGKASDEGINVFLDEEFKGTDLLNNYEKIIQNILSRI